MRAFTKYAILYVCIIGILVGMLTNLATAQDITDEPSDDLLDMVEEQPEPAIEVEAVEIDQAELDRVLAPVALYPDTLLSHIFVASTYPLELVQAARWRNANSDLTEQEALEAAEEKGWDPSVQALVPFTDLLNTLSEDLDWLQQLGDAFLLNEDQVLDSVQNLRRKAYEHGNLEDNEYIEVVEEDEDIVIETVHKEIVYVPYYDTRVVYGPWWWHSHPPLYWHRPAHYYWHAGFYWSPRIYIRPSFYFGGFHWNRRHLVVSHHYYRNPHRYHHLDHTRRVRVKEYQRWAHNPTHRRGVRYHQNTAVKVTGYQKHGRVVSRSIEVAKKPTQHHVSLSRPASANRYTHQVANSTQKKLKRQSHSLPEKSTRYSSVKRIVPSKQNNTSSGKSSHSSRSGYQKPKSNVVRSQNQVKQYNQSRQPVRSYNTQKRAAPSPKAYAQPQRHNTVNKPRTYNQRTSVKPSRQTTSRPGGEKQRRSNRKER